VDTIRVRLGIIAVLGFLFLAHVAKSEDGGSCSGPSNGVGMMTCGGGCSDQGWVCETGGKQVGQGVSAIFTCACDHPTANARAVTNGCCKFCWKKDSNGDFTVPGYVGTCQQCPTQAGACQLNAAGTDAFCATGQY